MQNLFYKEIYEVFEKLSVQNSKSIHPPQKCAKLFYREKKVPKTPGLPPPKSVQNFFIGKFT